MTLTEMLEEKGHPIGHVPNYIFFTDAKEVFKDWLKTVGLPLITGHNWRDGTTFDATESIRKLLITLVDEP